MSSNTTNLALYKVNPVTDGTNTFNIDTILNANWDKIDSVIGLLSTLNTTNKSNLVLAINEILSNEGALSSLTTTAKANLVAAINELNTQLSDLTNDRIYYCGTTSGSNTYTATNSNITAYADGLTVRMKIGTASTGASTLNINGLGAKAILDTLGNPIVSGGLKAGLPYQLCYNGTNFIVLGKGGGGNATAAQIIKGATATVDSGQVTGTLDLSNLVTGNIKSGVTINGIAGSGTVVDTSDAVLNPNFLLTGYSGYDDGVKKSGNMANRPNLQSALSLWTDGGGTLRPRIPTGGYVNEASSGVTEINLYDGNFIASNIVNGKNIFGLVGSYNPLQLVAGDNILYASGDSSIGPTTTFVLNKSAINHNRGGTVRVKFSLVKNTDSPRGQIYVNGVARGTLRTNSTGGTIQYIEDININTGDVIQIYTALTNGSNYCTLTGFQVCCGNDYGWFS